MNEEENKPPISENLLNLGSILAVVGMLISWVTMDFFLIKLSLISMIFIKTVGYHYFGRASYLFWLLSYAYLLVSVTALDHWIANPEAFQGWMEVFSP